MLRGENADVIVVIKHRLETLLSLPNAQQYLRPGLTLVTLKRIGKLHSDTEAARLMQLAKQRLFERLRKPA